MTGESELSLYPMDINRSSPTHHANRTRAIIEKAAKGLPIRHSITSSFKTLLTRPQHFFLSTPFLLIYTLYSATYMTANTIDTITSTVNGQKFSDITAGPAKFIATTAVNMSICVYKDSRFAKIFGNQPGPSPSTSPSSSAAPSVSAVVPKIPKVSYSLFCLRDSMTIFASFNLPPLIAPSVPDWIAHTPSMKAGIAQFASPAFMQIFSTPLHLLGLDLYNRQPVGGLGWHDRYIRVKRDWAVSVVARVGRIVPAYGVGGVVNTRLRGALMSRLEERETQKMRI